MDLYSDGWPNRDAFDYVSLIWKQLGNQVCNEILVSLKKEEPVIPLLETITFKPDWTAFEDWVIITDIVSKYDQTGKQEIRETVREITGKLNVVCGLIIEHPSFRFKLDNISKNLSFRSSIIREILNSINETIESNKPIMNTGIFDKPVFVNIGQSVIPKNILDDSKEGFKALGYSKQEAIDLINLISQDDRYKDGMEAGEIVTLGLMLSR